MARVDDRRPRRQRAKVSTSRNRYLVRAEYLKKHRPFLKALDAAILEWNQSNPAYSITNRSLPPEERDWRGEPYPPKLQSAFDDAYRREDRADGAFEVGRAWRQLAGTIAQDWWPLDLYPGWSTYCHPAMPFVAACLIWNPRLVPSDWITGVSIPLSGLPYHPDRERNPREEWWLTLWNNFMARLTEAFKEQPALTQDFVKEAAEQAFHSAIDAERTRPDRSLEDHYWIVPIIPLMSSSDWRNLESQVLESPPVKKMRERLHQRARDLHVAGWGVRRIGGELGYSSRTIQKWLDADTCDEHDMLSG